MPNYSFKKTVCGSIALIGISLSIDNSILSPAYGMEQKEAQQNKAAVSLKAMFQELINNMDIKTEDNYSSLKRGFATGGLSFPLDAFHLMPDPKSQDKKNSIAQANGLMKLAQNVLTNNGGTANGQVLVIPPNVKSHVDQLNEFAKKGTEETNFKTIFSPYIINFAAAAKKYGGGNIFNFDEANPQSILLFKYQAPDGSLRNITIYSMMSTIFEQADEMKKNDNQNPAFLENYKAIRDALSEAIMMHTSEGRLNQITNYIQNLDPKYTETALIEGVRLGKIDVTWLFEYLQAGMNGKNRLARN